MTPPELSSLGINFLGLCVFIILRDVMGGDKHLFEESMNLAQFPEDQNKNNRDQEQQDWDVHSFVSLAPKGL